MFKMVPYLSKYFRLDCQMCLKALYCDDYLKHCNPVIILLSRQCKFVKKHAIAATLNNCREMFTDRPVDRTSK